MKKLGLVFVMLMLSITSPIGCAQGDPTNNNQDVEDLYPDWLQEMYEEKVLDKTDFKLAMEDFELILNTFTLLDFNYMASPTNIKEAIQLKEFTSTFEGQGNVDKVVTMDQNIKVYFSTYSSKEGKRPTTGVDLYAVFINDLLVNVGVYNLKIDLDQQGLVAMGEINQVKMAKDLNKLPLELVGFGTMMIEGQPTLSMMVPTRYLEDELFNFFVIQKGKVLTNYIVEIDKVMQYGINYYLFSTALNTIYPEAQMLQ